MPASGGSNVLITLLKMNKLFGVNTCSESITTTLEKEFGSAFIFFETVSIH